MHGGKILGVYGNFQTPHILLSCQMSVERQPKLSAISVENLNDINLLCIVVFISKLRNDFRMGEVYGRILKCWQQHERQDRDQVTEDSSSVYQHTVCLCDKAVFITAKLNLE